jgi:hypothetical protein
MNDDMNMDSQAITTAPEGVNSSGHRLPLLRIRKMKSTITTVSSCRIALLAAVLSALLYQVSGFTLGSETQCQSRSATATLTVLQATRRTTSTSRSRSNEVNVIQRVQPRTSISEEKKRKALQFMARGKVESALTGVDAQMLELLSDQFIYPNIKGETQSINSKRPKGRPEYVPGAMNYETLVRFRERQDIMERVNENAVSEAEIEAITPYIANSVDVASIAPDRARKNGRTKVKGPVGDQGPATSLPTVASIEAAKRKRKRVVKNLPTPRTEAEKQAKKPVFKAYGNVELQHYYRTELLSAEEEYSIGIQIQLMVKCELVHEGMAVDLMRLPNMVEWAAACGYKVPDPTFVATEADEQRTPPVREEEEVEPRNHRRSNSKTFMTTARCERRCVPRS